MQIHAIMEAFVPSRSTFAMKFALQTVKISFLHRRSCRMTSIANALTAIQARSVISVKILVRQIHVKREGSVDDKVMTSSARVHRIERENCVKWNAAMLARVIHAKMVARVEKVPMDRHSFVSADRVIEEINVKLLPTHADPIHVFMEDFVSVLNLVISE